MPRCACRVLVVDDEPAMVEILQARIERWGFTVRTAGTVQHARELVDSFDPHLVISDLVLPDASGLALLEHLREGGGERTILLITAYGTIDVAVQAIKGGAADFLTKPLDYIALRRKIEEVDARLQLEPSARLDEHDATIGPGGMVGSSEAIVRMQDRIRVAAGSDAPVLVVGESGSGKELVARTLHELGARRERAFVPVNAAAIPETLAEGELFGFERGSFTGAHDGRIGLFEQAHQGTLFLDEFTEMPLPLQAKLLRVFEDGKVRRVGSRVETTCDVRVIAATNRDPLEAVRAGRLRHDLLYRLDVLRIDVPPLRARRQDVPMMVAHFLRECAQRYGREVPEVTADAMTVLREHDWPGNVRELRNVVERAFTGCADGRIDAALLGFAGDEEPASGGEAFGIVLPHRVTAAEAERILILETIKATGNNKAEAARRLGLDVKTIRNKLKLFDIGGTSS